MKRPTFIFAALTAFALVSACARPPAPVVVSGPATPAAALQVASSDVKVDVSALSAEGEVSPEAVEGFVRFFANKLERADAGGRKAVPVIQILDVSIASKNRAAFFPTVSSFSGVVSLMDAETGEEIVAPSPLDVEIGPHLQGELVAVNLRDRAEVKAEKMSKEFMRRARIALYGPNV
ncbi:MAG: hypothetical protein AAF367_07505 [Pseudomonadota bacterium]